MKVFAEQKWLSIAIFGSLLLGILLKITLGLMYNHMIKEADNMACTNNRLLKQCKQKFTSCFELNNGVSNVPVFVDKFINRMSIGPLSFHAIYHLSGQVMLLSVVFSGIGICHSIAAGCTMGEILPFYIVSMAGLYLFFSASTMADIQGKRRILKINLVDYLENHLSTKIHVTEKDMEMLYGKQRGEESPPKRKRSVDVLPITGRDVVPMCGREQAPARAVTENQSTISEEELEALLKEFLTG